MVSLGIARSKVRAHSWDAIMNLISINCKNPRDQTLAPELFWFSLIIKDLIMFQPIPGSTLRAFLFVYYFIFCRSINSDSCQTLGCCCLLQWLGISCCVVWWKSQTPTTFNLRLTTPCWHSSLSSKQITGFCLCRPLFKRFVACCTDKDTFYVLLRFVPLLWAKRWCNLIEGKAWCITNITLWRPVGIILRGVLIACMWRNIKMISALSCLPILFGVRLSLREQTDYNRDRHRTPHPSSLCLSDKDEGRCV